MFCFDVERKYFKVMLQSFQMISHNLFKIADTLYIRVYYVY